MNNKKLYTYFNSLFNLKESSKNYFTFDCPVCGKNKGAVNFVRDDVKCWKGCYKGSVKDFFVKVLRKNDWYIEVERYEETEFKVYEEALSIDLSPVSMPKGYVGLFENVKDLGFMARTYLEGRGYDLRDLDSRGFGYGVMGKYFGYVIAPYKVNGNLVYYQGRDFMDRGDDFRFRFPKKGEEVFCGKSDLWFNQDAVNMYEEVKIFEGWTDAVMYANGIASGGWQISNRQIEVILKSDCTSLTFYPDKGYLDKCMEVVKRFEGHKKVNIISFEDSDFKDLNEGGVERVEQIGKKEISFMDILKNKLK